MSQELQTAKDVVTVLVSAVAPEDIDVVEDAFEPLARVAFRPPPRSSAHAFDIQAEVVSMAVLLCSSVGALFMDAAKDAVKARAMELFKRWLSEPEEKKLAPAEINTLVSTVSSVGKELGMRSAVREQMCREVETLLTKYPSAILLRK